jgi:hypothetical protein
MTLTQGVVILLFGRVRLGLNSHDSEQEVRGIGQVPSWTMGQPNQLNQKVAALHLIRDLDHATHASFATYAFPVGAPRSSPLLLGQSKHKDKLYSLATTPINIHQLSVKLESYPIEQDKLQLLADFRFRFSLQYS